MAQINAPARDGLAPEQCISESTVKGQRVCLHQVNMQKKIA
mgnify:CR=1 FL=1